MSDLLTTGGSGFAGAIIGAIGSFLGLKTKINGIEKKVDTIAESVTYEDTCVAKHSGLEKRLEDHGAMLTEIRKDIKTLILK